MIIKKHFEQLRRLSFSDWKLLLQALGLLPFIALSLRVYGLSTTKTILLHFMHPKSSLHAPNSTELDRSKQIAKIVDIAARHGVYRTNCLKKSLALWFLLNKQKLFSVLHIGVQKDEELSFKAHAWLECDGIPLIDPKDIGEHFASFHKNK